MDLDAFAAATGWRYSRWDSMNVVQASPEPAHGLGELATLTGVDLDPSGYISRPDPEQGVATSNAGVYVAGGARGPVSLTEACDDAAAAAEAALAHLDPRLLRADSGVVASVQQQVEPDEPAAEELRLRFERALFAMLESGK